MENWLEKIKNVLMESMQKVLLFLGGLILILLGIIFWQMFQAEPEEEASLDLHAELLEESSPESSVPNTVEDFEEEIKPTEIIVDVKGAVHAPGVYTMVAEHRVIDAIEKAGGFLKDAEQKAVNLAKVVEDQMVIYIPTVGEEDGLEMDLNQAAVLPASEETTEALVNINKDGKEALMTLKGIGNSKADNIIAYREEQGFFQSIEEIKNVSGIGDATFESLKDQITVEP